MASTPETDREPEAGRNPAAGPAVPGLVATWLGRRDFAEVLALQLELRERVIAGETATMLLVEHPPVLTLGPRANEEDVLWDPVRRAEIGMTVVRTPRGGEVTLHAPGQLVVYPVLPIGRKIREHIVRLGEVGVALYAELGVAGCEFRMAHPGVWLGERKLASIGLHISRGVSVQGIALNLDVDPGLFAALVSCGLRGVEVTSARAVGGQAITVEAAGRRYAELFARSAGYALTWR